MKVARLSFVAVMLALPVLLTAQNADPTAGKTNGYTMAPHKHGNSAVTGSVLDRTDYSGAMWGAIEGNVSGTSNNHFYIVLQDSSTSAANGSDTTTHTSWTSVDSAKCDSLGNDVPFALRRYGGRNRYLRLIARASGGTNDTTLLSTFIILSGKRTQP